MKAMTVITNHDAVEPEPMGFGLRPRAGSSGWTDEKRAEVLRLWDLGMSARQIAEKVEAVSRNAVIGVVFRAGKSRPKPKVQRLTRPRTPPRERLSPVVKPTSSNPLGGKLNNFRIAGARMYPQPEQKPLPVLVLAPTPDTAKPWIERRFGECAYPVSGEGADTISCCAPVWEARGYCKAHSKVMFQKPRSDAQRAADKDRARRMRAWKARAA